MPRRSNKHAPAKTLLGTPTQCGTNKHGEETTEPMNDEDSMDKMSDVDMEDINNIIMDIEDKGTKMNEIKLQQHKQRKIFESPNSLNQTTDSRQQTAECLAVIHLYTK